MRSPFLPTLAATVSCALSSLVCSCAEQNDWLAEPDGGPLADEGERFGDQQLAEVLSSIWIANSAEGTVSRLDTVTGEEIGRYYSGPQEASGDPSRTSAFSTSVSTPGPGAVGVMRSSRT